MQAVDRSVRGRWVGLLVCGLGLALGGGPAEARRSPEAAVGAAATVSSHNQKGVVGSFALGGGAYTGDNFKNLSSVGVKLGWVLGYQLPMGERWSLTPEIALGYVSWGGDNDIGASMFTFGAGGKADYFLMDNLSGWAAVHLGGGSISAKPGDLSKGGFALNLEGGATYFMHKNVGVGAFIGINSTFAGKDDQTQLEMGATSFDFGLRLCGVYAL